MELRCTQESTPGCIVRTRECFLAYGEMLFAGTVSVFSEEVCIFLHPMSVFLHGVYGAAWLRKDLCNRVCSALPTLRVLAWGRGALRG